MKKYFYTDGKDKFGPFSVQELKNETLTRDTLVWYYGIEDWKKLSEIDELISVANSFPPELPTSTHTSESNKQVELETRSSKSEISERPESRGAKRIHWVIGSLALLVICLIIYAKVSRTSNRVSVDDIRANSYDVDFDYQMYVDKFYRDVGAYGIFPKKPKRTIIKYSKLDQMDDATHIHGLSVGFDNDDIIEIYINPSSWKNFNKQKRYYLMYHELSHDVLNLDDLSASESNEGKLMYPAISDYESISMDDFIESSHELFEQVSDSQ